jgi:hypothetical protein
MIPFLRGLFLIIIASMLWVTGWASLRCPLFGIPHDVVTHPWFIATLFDAYWGFITFFVWVCFKQTSGLARVVWFVAIILLGNIAMSAYWLNELFHVPRDGRVADIFTGRRNGIGVLGPVLAAIGIVVTVMGLPK